VIPTKSQQSQQTPDKLQRAFKTARFFAAIQIVVAALMLFLGVNMANDYSNSYVFGIRVNQAAPLFLGVGSTMVVTGIVVILSARKLLSHPAGHKKWGVIMLFSCGLGRCCYFPEWLLDLCGCVGGDIQRFSSNNIQTSSVKYAALSGGCKVLAWKMKNKTIH
jgi:hypothetical protein